MSTVRPICVAEEKHGRGEPIASYGAFFGFTAGLLTHLKMHGLTANQSWFPNSRAKQTGTILLLGGLFGGYTVGQRVFGDDALRRLSASHALDRRVNNL